MAMSRGGFSHLLAPGFRKVVFDEYNDRPIEGKALVNMNTSTRAYEEVFQFSGFGTLRNKPEGAQVPYEDAKQGNIKRYTWSTWALGFRITLEMRDDDLYAVVGSRLSRALARSARNNLEIIMHAPYNDAFDTTVNGFNSGESLVSTSHALIRGGTLSNRPAVDADLSILSLQAGLEHFHGLTDESGMPIVVIPKKLIYSVGDYWIANQLLKSQMLPGGNQNDINQISREGLMPHLSHYLTDSDAWFLLADQHGINYWDRRKFAMANSDDFRTGDAEFRGMARRGSGFDDWRGIYGSQGV